MKNVLMPIAVAAAAVMALPASAVTLEYGVPFAGTGPTAPFATLTYEHVGDGDDWLFTLSAADLDAIFGSDGGYIGAIAVAAPGASSLRFHGVTPMSHVDGGVDRVAARRGRNPGGDFDIRFAVGRVGDRLTSGETVSWTWNDSTLTSFADLALRVQGLHGNSDGNSGWIWYEGAALVPEPDTYALMLAGVAGIALLRRRRQGG